MDAEGRAVDVDAARRILAIGVAPQNQAASSPLYKLEGALRNVQRAAGDADEGSALYRLDVEGNVVIKEVSSAYRLAHHCHSFSEFAEASERIAFELQKADFQFYGCAFAPGGQYTSARWEVPAVILTLNAIQPQVLVKFQGFTVKRASLLIELLPTSLLSNLS